MRPVRALGVTGVHRCKSCSCFLLGPRSGSTVQCDEYVWFDETRAVRALPAPASEGVPDTYPFGV